MTILNMYTEVSGFLVLPVLAGILGIIMVIVNLCDNKTMVLVGVGIIAFAVFFGLFGVPVYTYYEATIDDVTTIQEPYKIVEQRGSIYVVKDLSKTSYACR